MTVTATFNCDRCDASSAYVWFTPDDVELPPDWRVDEEAEEIILCPDCLLYDRVDAERKALARLADEATPPGH